MRPGVVEHATVHKKTTKHWVNVVGVVKVNPLCGQRQSLLAQARSSNNQTMLTRRFLIANQR